MARDIPGSLRQVLDSDSARAIVATAAGELIKNAPVPRKNSEQQVPPLLSGIGGFAAGAGTVTLVPVAVRRIGKLVRGARRRPLFADVQRKAAAGTRKAMDVPQGAVDVFASRLGGRASGATASRGTPAARTGAKRTATANRNTSGKRSPSGNGSGARTGAKRTTAAKRSTGANRSSPRTAAKRSTTAKRTGSANGSRARTTSKSRTARKPVST